MRDAAIVSITVIGRALARDHVSVIINDGHRRLMSREKAYRLVVDLAPSLAAEASMMLRDERSFVVSVEDASIEELVIDEKRKAEEVVGRLRAEMTPRSLSVISAARRERAALSGPRGIRFGELKSLDKLDDYIRKVSDGDRPPEEDISLKKNR